MQHYTDLGRPTTQGRSRMQQGIGACEEAYQVLDDYVSGRSETPPWVAVLSLFRSGLDFIKADVLVPDGGHLATENQKH